jgi:5-deoxy-glucuronate isomerase
MAMLSLAEHGATYTFDTGPHEVGVDVLGGAMSVMARGPNGTFEHNEIGLRGTPFAGPPTMLYLPRSTSARFTCLAPPLDAIVFKALARRDSPPRLVRPSECEAQSFGRANWQRTVYPCIGIDVDADMLMMGETHTPSGNWSSYPPHKHDTEQPPESASEEIYHFRIDPEFGFGLQTLWDPTTASDRGGSIAHVVHDGDTVVIPRGYHPVVVAPGFRMITVWAYAGDRRSWGNWSTPPEYARLLEQFDLHREG